MRLSLKISIISVRSSFLYPVSNTIVTSAIPSIISTHQVRDIDSLLDHVVIIDGTRVLLNASCILPQVCMKMVKDIKGIRLIGVKSVNEAVGIDVYKRQGCGLRRRKNFDHAEYQPSKTFKRYFKCIGS